MYFSQFIRQYYLQCGPYSYRSLALVVLGTISLSTASFSSTQLHVGASIVEEGDDRPHPAASLRLNWEERYIASFHVYGEDMDPVSSRNYLVSAQHLFSFMNIPGVQGGIGVSALRREIYLPSANDNGGSYAGHNLGGSVGIYYTPIASYPLQLSWESNLYPAGIGAILLTTARRQVLTLSGGVSW